jgi:hypothetical protein
LTIMDTQILMFISCSRFLPLILPTLHHGHVLLPLLLGNKRLSRSVAHVNASWNMSKYARLTRRTAAIPGIKLSHLVPDDVLLWQNMLQNMYEIKIKQCLTNILRRDAHTRMYCVYTSSDFPNDGTRPRHLNLKDKKIRR